MNVVQQCWGLSVMYAPRDLRLMSKFWRGMDQIVGWSTGRLLLGCCVLVPPCHFAEHPEPGTGVWFGMLFI